MMRPKSATVRAAIGLGLCTGLWLVAGTPEIARAKDANGPSSAACGSLTPSTPAWSACISAAAATQSDADLFYAGYWLARTGDYEGAIRHLARAKAPDERILTYIGFAVRKLGRTDEAFGYYARALAMNPDYVVARSYLGEAYLAKGQTKEARLQLAEIASRCGTSCEEYVELDRELRRFDAQHNGQG